MDIQCRGGRRRPRFDIVPVPYLVLLLLKSPSSSSLSSPPPFKLPDMRSRTEALLHRHQRLVVQSALRFAGGGGGGGQLSP
jgi:hypothetical protein